MRRLAILSLVILAVVGAGLAWLLRRAPAEARPLCALLMAMTIVTLLYFETLAQAPLSLRDLPSRYATYLLPLVCLIVSGGQDNAVKLWAAKPCVSSSQLPAFSNKVRRRGRSSEIRVDDHRCRTWPPSRAAWRNSLSLGRRGWDWSRRRPLCRPGTTASPISRD